MAPLSHDDAMDLASVMVADADMPWRAANLRLNHRNTLRDYDALFLGVGCMRASCFRLIQSGTMTASRDCPKCGTTMVLARAGLSDSLLFQQTLQCPSCENVLETAKRFDASDPDVVKWLRSGLHSPE